MIIDIFHSNTFFNFFFGILYDVLYFYFNVRDSFFSWQFREF